ncbi:MAG: DUF4340 domain-containing protein [Pseudomonadota bacterium]
MDSKKFKILAVIALALFVMAGMVHSAYDTWTLEKVDGEKLFPDFDGYADGIARVMVQKGETKIAFIKQHDGTWTLADRGAYPVISQKVRETLGRLATAQLVEAKTRDPERYDLLDLGDPARQDANATLVKLSDAEGNLLGEIVIGKQSLSAFGNGRSGSYVRHPDRPQTWLANIILDVPLDVRNWVEPVFLKLPSDKVKLIELTDADGQKIKLIPQEQAEPAEPVTGKTEAPGGDDTSKDDEAETQILKQQPAKFEFAAIPEGKKLKDDVDPTEMVKALETLELTDVRKAGSVEAPRDATSMKARVETKDGIKLDITVLKIGEDERWLSINVSAEGKDAEAARKIKADVEGWEFRITSWRSGQIFKTAAEIFDASEEEKKADETETPDTKADTTE